MSRHSLFGRKPEPPVSEAPALSDRRAELAEINARLIGLRQRQTELAKPNARVETLLREESEASAAFNGVAALEAQDAARWVAEGGDRPAPRTEERQRAQAALDVARAAADGARRADQDRQNELAAITGDLQAAAGKQRAVIAEIIRFELVPEMLRRYVEATIGVNREFIALRTIAALLDREYQGLVPVLFRNLHALPAVVGVPQPDVAGEIEPIDLPVAALTAEADTAVRQFAQVLGMDATAEWAP